MKILYAHTTTPDYVRCLKNIKALSDAGHDVHFLGARRTGGPRYDPMSFADIPRVSIELFDEVIPHGARSSLALASYLMTLRRRIRETQPDVLLLTNEELALATAFLKSTVPIVIDAIDALDIRRESGWLAQRVLGAVGRYARSKADLIVEVEEFRSRLRPEYGTKTIVVRNTPSLASLRATPDIVRPEKQLAGSPYVYASGSLNSGLNGIETLLDSIKHAQALRIVVAGFVSDARLLRLFAENRTEVQFLGPVSHAQSLALARNSLAMFAHYNPRIRNFALAAPNKVYEAFALGKPLLINSECMISEFCRSQGFGFTSPYGDADALSNELQALLGGVVAEDALSKAAAIFANNYAWEIEQTKLIAAIGKLGSK